MAIENIQRSIPNLAPETKYVFRVRSLNGLGVYSAWSDALTYVTPSIATIPDPPSNLVIDFTTPNINLSWTPPTANVDGSPLIGISYYQIHFNVGAVTTTYISNNPNYVYPFAQNAIDFGTAQPEVNVSIYTLDLFGNLSATALTGTAINVLPPTPTLAPVLVAAFTLMNITMPQPTVPDLGGFILQESPDDTTWATIYTGSQNTYTQTVLQNTTYYYRYKYYDVFNQDSPNYSPVGSTTTLNTNPNPGIPPKVPTGLTVTPGIDTTTFLPYADVTWAAVTEDTNNNTITDLNRYELRYLHVGFSAQEIEVGPSTTYYRITGLSKDSSYQISIQAYDNFQNASGFSSIVGFSTTHDTTPPANPSGTSVTPVANGNLIQWTPNTEADLNNYVLYGSTTSGFTPGAGNIIYNGNASFYVQMGTPGTLWYYVLKAQDNQGNNSGYTAQFSGTMGTTTSAALTSGTIGGTTVAANQLQGGTITGANYYITNSATSGIQFQGTGNITWAAGATGGITVSNSGYIQSANYTGTTGWSLGPSGLTINGGTISAAALQIGISSVNLVPNSSFENPYESTTTVVTPTNWVASGATVSINTTNFLFGRQSLQVVPTGTSGFDVYQNIVLAAPIPSGTPVTYSYWIKQTAGTAAHPTIHVDSVAGSTTLFNQTAAILTLNTWTRASYTLSTSTAMSTGQTIAVHVGTTTSTTSDNYYIDGVQLQLSSYATDYAPTPLEIPQNYIQSAMISNLNANQITAGSGFINNLTIASGGSISSFNSTSSTGYSLGSTGAVFQNGGISLVGASGSVLLDSSSLRAVYSGTTEFQVDNTGIYVGGNSTTNSTFYVNPSTSTAVFQSPSATGGYQLSLNMGSTPPNNKVIELKSNTTGLDSFYLTNTGVGYFAGGVITGGGANIIANSSFEAVTGNSLNSAYGTTVADKWGPYIFTGGGTPTTAYSISTTTGVIDGLNAQKIIFSANSAGYIGIYDTPVTSAGVGVWPANTTWQISWWACETGSGGLSMFQAGISDAGGFTDTWVVRPGYNNVPAPSATVPQRYVITRTVGGSNVTSKFYIASGNTADTIEIDAVQVEQSLLATPYAPTPNEVLSIHVGATTNGFYVDQSGDFWTGSSALSTAPFSVTAAGALKATNATITGTINATSGTISGTLSVTGTLSGGTISGATISAGSINIGSGAFTVNSSGALYANNANISGSINASSGTLGNLNISGTLSGGTINGTTISAGTINAPTINNCSSFSMAANTTISGSGVMYIGAPNVTITGSPVVLNGQVQTQGLFTTQGQSYSFYQGTSDEMMTLQWVSGLTAMNFPSPLPNLTTGVEAVYTLNSNQLGYYSSSIEFKQNVRDLSQDNLSGENNPLYKFRPRKFQWRNDKMMDLKENDHVEEIGFIVEELEITLPELIAKNSEGISISYGHRPILALAVEAIQTLKKRIDALEAQQATPNNV